MSGGTGSRRFMSPEVALSEPYSLSADIYSFAILLWEVLTLKKAFANMPVDEHREKVIKNNERPELNASWSEEIQSLLQKCWKRSPFDRPDAREVHRILKKECQTIYWQEFAPK
jgi:serine/threonine protein kinase